MKTLTIFLSFFLSIILTPIKLRCQTIVKSLDASTISQIPLNRFFIYSADGNLHLDSSFACVKTNADVEAYIKLLDTYHRVKAINSPEEFRVPTKIWEAVKRPSRFYQLHNVEMKIYYQKNYHLLTFTTKTPNLKKSDEYFERGVSLQEIDYLQTNLNHLLFNSPLQSAFNYGSNAHNFYLSVEEQRQMKLSEIFKIYKLPEERKEENHGVWFFNRLRLDSFMTIYESASLDGDSNYALNFGSLIHKLKYSNQELYLQFNSRLYSYNSISPHGSQIYSIDIYGDTLSMNYFAHDYYRWTLVGDYVNFNYFNEKQQLDSKVTFHLHKPDSGIYFGDPPISNLISTIKDLSSRADTLNYVYGENGQMMYINPSYFQMERHCQSRNYPIQAVVRPAPDLQKTYTFYQLYVGEEKMENYFNNHLGYTPRSIFMELYRYGTFIFKLDPISNKYYMDETLILE